MRKIRIVQFIDKPENLAYWLNALGISFMDEVVSIHVERTNDMSKNFLIVVELYT